MLLDFNSQAGTSVLLPEVGFQDESPQISARRYVDVITTLVYVHVSEDRLIGSLDDYLQKTRERRPISLLFGGNMDVLTIINTYQLMEIVCDDLRRVNNAAVGGERERKLSQK